MCSILSPARKGLIREPAEPKPPFTSTNSRYVRVATINEIPRLNPEYPPRHLARPKGSSRYWLVLAPKPGKETLPRPRPRFPGDSKCFRFPTSGAGCKVDNRKAIKFLCRHPVCSKLHVSGSGEISPCWSRFPLVRSPAFATQWSFR
jgi:hypothetical protein